MPPKKPPTRPTAKQTNPTKGSSSTASKAGTSKVGATAKKTTGKSAVKVPVKGGKATSSSSKTKIAAKKKEPSKEDVAASKIQACCRMYIAKQELKKRRQKKEEYDRQMDDLQKKAWLEIIEREREEAEKERLKEQAERQRKKEEQKRRAKVLEAAFDGEVDVIRSTLNEVEQADRSSGLSGQALEVTVRRHQHAIVECEDANTNTPLSEAGAGGDVDTIQFLVDHGAEINSQGHFKRTPLYRAAFGGHFDAVKYLLEHGADPSIHDSDGQLPEQISPCAEITELLKGWDLDETRKILEKAASAKEERMAEEKEYLEKEKKRLNQDFELCEKDYKAKQKVLQKAHEELNKRIFEHDKCVAEGFDRPEITLQAIEDAEGDLLKAKREEEEVRKKLTELRLEMRQQEKNSGGDGEDPDIVKCNIRELDEVLCKDVGNKIKESGKYPLVLDPSTQSVMFLRYRDTNFLTTLNARDMEAEVLRKALLGAIRFGKPLVLDMMDVDMMEPISERFDAIQEGLFQQLVSGKLIKERKFFNLIKDSDGAEYKKSEFVDMRIDNFKLIITTKLHDPQPNWKEIFYVIKIVVSGS